MKTISTYTMASCKKCNDIFKEQENDSCPGCGGSPRETWVYPLEETVEEHIERLAKEAATAAYTSVASFKFFDWVISNDKRENDYLPDGVEYKSGNEGTWVCNLADNLRESFATTQAALKALAEADIQDDEKITLSWHVDDIKGQAENRSMKITDQQAKDVLQAVKHKHDACIGVNWEVIDFHLDNVPALEGSRV